MHLLLSLAIYTNTNIIITIIIKVIIIMLSSQQPLFLSLLSSSL